MTGVLLTDAAATRGPNEDVPTTQRGCNPSMVRTSAGDVIIDTPQLPTKAVAIRAAAERLGAIRYIINTEHLCHIVGTTSSKGAVPLLPLLSAGCVDGAVATFHEPSGRVLGIVHDECVTGSHPDQVRRTGVTGGDIV